MATNQGCRGLIPCDKLHFKFLYYFLVGNVPLLNDLGVGTTFKELSASKLKSVNIPIPPLPEQKRVVAILDEAFTAIETAIANTKKNIANARALFESQLRRMFTGDAVDQGWMQFKIEDIVQPLTTVDPKKSPSKSFEYIDVSSVSRSTHTIQEPTMIFGSEAPSRARRKVQSGDVLFATIRPTLQRIAVVPENLDGAICSTGYYVLRPRDQVISSYLFYYLFSGPFSAEMDSLQRGASYPAVSDRDIKEHIIYFPPLPEQKRIVAILDKVSANTTSLVRIGEQKLNHLAELKQSLLQQAFTGELTACTNTIKSVVLETQK